MMYNITGLQNGYVSGLITTANSATNGLFIGLSVLAFFFVLLMNLMKKGTVEAFMVSSFSMFIVSGILAYAGFLNFLFVILFLVILAISGLYKMMS